MDLNLPYWIVALIATVVIVVSFAFIAVWRIRKDDFDSSPPAGICVVAAVACAIIGFAVVVPNMYSDHQDQVSNAKYRDCIKQLPKEWQVVANGFNDIVQNPVMEKQYFKSFLDNCQKENRTIPKLTPQQYNIVVWRVYDGSGSKELLNEIASFVQFDFPVSQEAK